MFDDDEEIRSNLVAGLGQSSKPGAPTFEEASETLLRLYRAYAGSGPICKALLDADLDVAGLLKKARAVLASSDMGVAWFASSWIDSLIHAKGALDISRSSQIPYHMCQNSKHLCELERDCPFQVFMLSLILNPKPSVLACELERHCTFQVSLLSLIDFATCHRRLKLSNCAGASWWRLPT